MKLSWTTYAEIDNDYFVVEKSLNGKDYYSIGTQDGMGNSTTLNKYEFYDFGLSDMPVYYRLKQVDFDGTFSYSKVCHVSPCEMVTEPDFHFYMSGNNLVISSFGLNHESDLQLLIFNSVGETVFTKSLSI